MEADNKLDYQREKNEIAADLDKIELTNISDIKLVKDKITQTQNQIRAIQQEQEKENKSIEKEEQQHRAKMGEWQVVKK